MTTHMDPPPSQATSPGDTPERVAPKAGVWKYLGIGVTGGALALVLLLVALAVVVPFAAGAQNYAIMTDSMRPSYPPGTMVVVKPVGAEDLRVGDVITYQIAPGEPAVITHRIVEKTLNSDGVFSFTTLGDNNAVVDPVPIVAEQIRGKVWYALPWLGHISLARSDSVVGILIPIAGIVLVGYGIWQLITWAIKGSRDKRQGNSAQ